MAKLKRILVICPDVNHGLVWQRIHVPFTKLDPSEFKITCMNLHEIRHVDLHYHDILVMCHANSKDELKLLVKAKNNYNLKVVCDLDDLLTELPTDHENYGALSKSDIASFIMAADHMVYSTQYLADKFRHLNPTQTVVENCIDHTRYKVDQYIPPHKNCFIVGWTGSQHHKADQYITFAKALDTFLTKNADVKAKFHLVCPDFLHRKHGTQVIFEPNVVHHLDYAFYSLAYCFDLCLVGLDENAYNDAKSDLKLLEMGVLGIPIIASPRSDFIRHKDKDIMLYAETEGAWYAQLEWAKDNPEKLKAIGQRAREYVIKERHPQIAADKWAKVLSSTVETYQTGCPDQSQ